MTALYSIMMGVLGICSFIATYFVLRAMMKHDQKYHDEWRKDIERRRKLLAKRQQQLDQEGQYYDK